MNVIIVSLFLAFLNGAIQARSFSKRDFEELSFVVKRLEKGRQVTRVAHNGVLGMETSVPNIDEAGLFLREVTDGNHVAKLVYSDMNTIETCDVLKNDVDEVAKFLAQFVDKKDIKTSDLQQGELIKHLQKGSNVSSEMIDGSTVLSPAHHSIIDISDLRKQCHDTHKALKQRVRLYNQHKKAHQTEGLAEEEIYLGVVQKNGRSRTKREGELIYPGTMWCGKGTLGSEYTDLGESRGTDKCCRTHDFCPYYIEGMTTDYGYYNYRFTTLSHCDCDERFRTCLKFQNSPVANNIGELYFNKIKTKCFTFKQERVCAKRSWWGTCTEWKNELKAVIQEPLHY